MPEIDHLVFASRHLEEGIAHIEALTGVRARAGGPHPGIGTHNALLGFDGASYFEIIAVDPDQPRPPHPRPFGLDDGPSRRLAGFAVHPSGGETLESVADTMRSAGWDPGPVAGMRRTTPEGKQIGWRLTRPPGPVRPGDGVLPFVIDWGDTPSPALSAPPMGRLEALQASHPDAAVRAVLRALDLGLEVVEGPPGLTATVRTARGRVRLT
jgi:hypothetical protein